VRSWSGRRGGADGKGFFSGGVERMAVGRDESGD
jgi:hypothetical protein